MSQKEELIQSQENGFDNFDNKAEEKKIGALREQEKENKVEIKIPKAYKAERKQDEYEDENTIAVYPYKSLEGTTLYEVIRRTGRGEPFLIRHKDESGKYIYKRPKNVDLVIYNLPRVKATIEDGKPIWITEGESKADTLNDLGFTATTCAFKGTDKWYPFYNEYLKGVKTLFILIDNDEASEEFAEHVTQIILNDDEDIEIYPIRINEICSSLTEGADIDNLIEVAGKETIKATLETIEKTYILN